MSFERFITAIKALDPVAAGVVNKPMQQIDSNVRYLWDVLQAASIGSTVYALRKAVEAEANVGMPVYYRKSTGQFERGLAVMDSSQAGGILRPAASAQVWGIVANKINATLADILLFGTASIDIAAAVDGTVTEGAYYLSGATPGKLVQQRTPVSVMVLRSDGAGTVFVQPQYVDFLDRHVHYKFDLRCHPAGSTSPPTTDGHHQVNDPDITQTGWLPADHGIFEGHAPPQALFGYNISADSALAAVWPPIPTSSATLEWDKGLDPAIGATAVSLGEHGLVIIDRHGIWWTSDCYGDAPWPVDLDTSLESSASTSDSGGECPRELHMGLTLWFTKPNFATDTTVVTSLVAKDDRLKITCQGTDTEASAGNLEIDLNLNLVVTEDAEGFTALKTFDHAANTFTSGNVVEGLFTTQSNVILSGDASRVLTAVSGTPTLYQGKVQIAVLPAATVELDTQLVRLDGVEESFYTDPPIMFLTFPAAEESEIRGRINVPTAIGISNPTLALRFLVLGRAAGTLPALTVTARRLPRPSDGITVPVDLPLAGDEFTVTCDFTGVLTSANQYIEVTSDAFTIADGDTVFYTVKRLATDGYAGDVGLIRPVGIVVAG